MNSKLTRIFVLIVTFLGMFGAVTAFRIWRNGGNIQDLFPALARDEGTYQPEKFTLPETAALDPGDVDLLSRLNAEYAKLTEAVVPSVVSIDTMRVRSEQLLDGWGGTRVREFPTHGSGSGAIVTKEGHIVTNHHVIAGQEKIQVRLHGGKSYTARLVGEDALLDIAVLKIDSDETFTPLKMGDSMEVKVGQIVVAVGNPFGLGETVTQGIISAKERSLSDNQRDLFQTDAAINPGNSGGPLVNLRGEIIGINVAIFSPDKQNPGFQGVGFSIPSNDVKEALFQILERGRPIRGFLGVQMRDLDPTVRSALGYDEEDGAAVIGVSPGSPAQAAGLQPWDVVRSLNGKKIRTAAQLLGLIQRAKVGEPITLDTWRNGKSLQLKATIAESGSNGAPTQQAPSPRLGSTQDPEAVLQLMGIHVRDLAVPERMRGFRGVAVREVSAAGIAASRVRMGDLIIAVNGSRVSSAREFYLHLAASAAVQTTNLHIIRDGQVFRLDLPAIPAES